MRKSRKKSPSADGAPPPPADAGVEPGNPLDPFQSLITGQPVGPETPLRAGDPVQIRWGGGWWPGEVVTVRKDGRVGIHYRGWDASYDEIVTRDRLKLELATGKRLVVHFAAGWSVAGRFVSVADDFLVLARTEDDRQLLVNKRLVAYCEVVDETAELSGVHSTGAGRPRPR